MVGYVLRAVNGDVVVSICRVISYLNIKKKFVD